MDYDEASFMHLIPVAHNFERMWVYRILVPSAQKDVIFKKHWRQPWDFWSLILTIEDCVEQNIGDMMVN